MDSNLIKKISDELNENQLKEIGIAIQSVSNQLNILSASQNANQRKIVCVTSGGTSVPLEKNTIRSIENFSTGQRGALSTEEFLKQGYFVIFLYRKNSLFPYTWKYKVNQLFDSMIQQEQSGDFQFSNLQQQIEKDLKLYKETQQNMIPIAYETVNEYLLFLLRLAELFAQYKYSENTIFYLASAVSDFFIPKSEMSEHKIQSKDYQTEQNNDGLILKLHKVTKIMKQMKNISPKTSLISFKLETDVSILQQKVEQSRQQYNIDFVIGNTLQNRRNQVYIYNFKQNNPQIIEINMNQSSNVEFIEELMIQQLTKLI